jgi:hypothetical protein
MHAQQSFLNVCNTAILGYHGDKIFLYKNVKNVKNYGQKSFITSGPGRKGLLRLIF